MKMKWTVVRWCVDVMMWRGERNVEECEGFSKKFFTAKGDSSLSNGKNGEGYDRWEGVGEARATHEAARAIHEVAVIHYPHVIPRPRAQPIFPASSPIRTIQVPIQRRSRSAQL
ncbi:hypothetical protein EJ06DRAFT_125772 [Trichodelitschia bisporula]|uniref:Uncharacterized protein n=1 Tax=Trichodelitschia bisporula TaxID=703511 RepID=A0A6G1HQP8_9PEZI|nr:hypothetical protein EJ06DRAFT_125772 [Trichodelitschia bisporula]